LWTVRDLAARYGSTIIETADVNSEETIGLVQRLGSDVIVVMNFDQILKERFIQSPKIATINIHPSLLPAFRGPCPVFWALVEGCHELGVTVHLIEDEEIDAGPVIAQDRVAWKPTVSVAEATSMLFDQGVRLLIAHLSQDLRSQSCAQVRSASTYQTFPTRHEIAVAKAKGVRLCRWDQLVRLASAALRPASSVGRRGHVGYAPDQGDDIEAR
jgi:methionyl-tRNA formyltransferase